MILLGDLFDVLPTLEAASIDSCVTDPPYGIGFMGREWDTFKPEISQRLRERGEAWTKKRPDNPNLNGRTRQPGVSPSAVEYNRSLQGQRQFQDWTAQWSSEVFRVLKPGAHLVVCGAPRSFHRMTCGLEDAGFEIRDCCSYLFGQGFPKSHNFGCKCRENALPYTHNGTSQIPERDVRPLFHADVPATVNAPHEQGQVLLDGVPEQGLPAHGHTDGAGVDEGREQSGMEGRELHRAGEGLSDDPTAGPSSSAGKRLRGGTSGDRGTDAGPSSKSGRGSPSQGSGSGEQRPGQSASLRLPSKSLADGARHRGTRCERCGGLTEARGFGSALKPGWEPVIIARKPFKGTLADNYIRYGVGGLNVDGRRIDGDKRDPGFVAPTSKGIWGGAEQQCDWPDADLGRWPANVLLDEQAAEQLDQQSGDLDEREVTFGGTRRSFSHFGGAGTQSRDDLVKNYGDRGGASRFFYVAKPSREERDYGCESLPARSGGEATNRQDGSAGVNNPRAGAGRTGGARNIHPTVKPIALMRWLVRLVTPLNGTVLDPFTGSGTTGMACRYEQRHFVGIEREAEYLAIAEKRIAAVTPLFGEATA